MSQILEAHSQHATSFQQILYYLMPPPHTQSVIPERKKDQMRCFLCYNANLHFFLNSHINSNGCKLSSLGRRGKEVIMTNYPFSKLSSSCSVSVKLFLQHSSPQAQLTPLLACYLYLLDQTSTSAYLSRFRGWDDELHGFQSLPSEVLVVTSLNIFKDKALDDHFHLNLSIIMIEGDRLSFTQERMVHFSSLHVASTLSVSHHTTLTCNFAKR